MSRKVTRNSCNMCTPLGAALAFRGVEGCVPLLHGSQGCATYMRRFIISHFREPVDIASSSFSEDSAVFGGRPLLLQAIRNVTKQYSPALLGVATTCLSETIGDDVRQILRSVKVDEETISGPPIVATSTPSYQGNHTDGFISAVRALVETLGDKEAPSSSAVNLFPSILSCEDLREFKNMFAALGLSLTILPDYSTTLDSGAWKDYRLIPSGGTTISQIAAMNGAQLSVEFCSSAGTSNSATERAAGFLEKTSGVRSVTLHAPIGVTLTDRFWEAVCTRTGTEMPVPYREERARVLDAYADAHKYLSGKKVALIGDVDFIVPMASFAVEIGLIPVLVATGAGSTDLRGALRNITSFPWEDETEILEKVDFEEIGETVKSSTVELMIGSSRGYKLARRLDVPLVRAGFPVHDRIGGPRICHVGYRGALELLDRICNQLIERSQDRSPVGYSYM